MIRVLIVEHTSLMCDLVRAAIDDDNGIKVVGTATSRSEAVEMLGECDVVTVRHDLPNSDALKIVQDASTDYPDVKSVVMGLPKSEPIILTYIEAGAAGYILHNDSLPKLVQQIFGVHSDRPIVGPEIVAALMERLAEMTGYWNGSANNLHRLSDLTPREQEVLQLIGESMTNSDIAEHLFIEVGTVKNHVHSILKKLNVRSRHDAMAYVPVLESMEADTPATDGTVLQPPPTQIM